MLLLRRLLLVAVVLKLVTVLEMVVTIDGSLEGELVGVMYGDSEGDMVGLDVVGGCDDVFVGLKERATVVTTAVI